MQPGTFLIARECFAEHFILSAPNQDLLSVRSTYSSAAWLSPFGASLAFLISYLGAKHFVSAIVTLSARESQHKLPESEVESVGLDPTVMCGH